MSYATRTTYARPSISNPTFVPTVRSQDKVNVSGSSAEVYRDAVTSRKSPFNNRWWWEELAAAALSVSCVVAVIAVLWAYDGRSLSSWPLPISLNSLLAVFTTLAKTALLVALASCISQLKWLYFEEPRNLDDLTLFDEASRGPWGSVRLLFGLHIRTLLGSSAALLTIAALGVEPSVQQILAFPSRNTMSSLGNSSIGLATSFDTAQMTINESNERGSLASVASETTRATLAVHGSVLEGLYNITQPLAFDCPTAACSWPDFTTFGMCGSCTDITEQAQRNKTSEKFTCQGHYAGDLPWACSFSRDLNGTLTNYSVPNGLTVFGHPEVLQQILVDPPDTCDTHYRSCALADIDPIVSMLNVTTFYNWDQSKNQDEPELALMHNRTNFFGFRGYTSRGNSSIFSKTEVYDCALNWCAQTYTNVRSRNGKLHTDPPVEIPLTRLTTDNGDSLVQNLTRNIPYWNATAVDFQVFLPHPDHVHKVAPGFEDAKYLVNSISSTLFSGYLVELLMRDMFFGDQFVTADTELLSRPTYLTSVSEALYTSGFEYSVKSIAKAVTQKLRTGMNSTLHHGDAYTQETYIRVRWGWLAPTIVIVLVTNLILSQAILHSSRHENRHQGFMWKCSPLAYLFHGLEGWHSDDLQVGTLHQMEKKGKDMRARLGRNDAGQWKFMRIDKDASG